MKSPYKVIIFFFLFFLFQHSLQALDVNITGKELTIDHKGEYNRSFNLSWEFSTFGAVEINNNFTIKSGIALGSLENDFEFKSFSSIHASPLSQSFLGRIPFYINLAYIFYNLPGPAYDIHSHTVLPFISYNGLRAGISLGVSFRFTVFFDEYSIFESVLSFSLYFNFINNEKLRVGLQSANFNDFYSANTGAYSLSLNAAFYISNFISLMSSIELMQVGSIALSASYYGVAYRGGIRFTW